ncbi:MAG: type III secretion system chaperone [Pseudomonadota bacterium]
MKQTSRRIALLCAVGTVLAGAIALAQPSTEEGAPEPAGREAMTAQRLGELILRVDETAQNDGSRWVFRVVEVQMMLVFDESNNRMRLMTPIREAEKLSADELRRLMQANFDTALDARYGLAGDVLWGTFIHPLGTLTDEDFLVAIGQVANVAITYGDSYSSGLLMFGGGDTGQRQRDLIDQLRQKRSI